MNTSTLLLHEISHRRVHFVLSALAILVAAALFVASPALLRAYRSQSEMQLAAMRVETEHELRRMQAESEALLADAHKRTKRIMRDMGFNLRIVHRNTDLSKLYANFVSFEMPEEYIDRLANSPELTKVAHLVATLKQMIEWEGHPRLLVGIAPETPQAHVEKKSPMGYQIKPGEVFLGAVSAGERHAVGDVIDIHGSQFKVADVLASHGTRDDDIAIFMNLADAQQLLGKPGKISEIIALGCKCKTIDRAEEIQAQLELVLPEAKVMEIKNLADARENQRELVANLHREQQAKYEQDREQLLAAERKNHAAVLALLEGLANVVTPLVVLAAALWIGLLAWTNVRERRSEIGLLRALGKRSSTVAALFLGKAIVLGFIGGGAGSLLGLLLGRAFARNVFGIAPELLGLNVDLLLIAVGGAPLIAVVASYLPAIIAFRQDPAVVLNEA